MHNKLDGMLDVLDERESRIIGARFGLRGVTPMTLKEVGREFGVSRERIRQIQAIALEKLRTALRRKDQPRPVPVGLS
jgi:RNA polymerase primary sigma factor